MKLGSRSDFVSSRNLPLGVERRSRVHVAPNHGGELMKLINSSHPLEPKMERLIEGYPGFLGPRLRCARRAASGGAVRSALLAALQAARELGLTVRGWRRC